MSVLSRCTSGAVLFSYINTVLCGLSELLLMRGIPYNEDTGESSCVSADKNAWGGGKKGHEWLRLALVAVWCSTVV